MKFRKIVVNASFVAALSIGVAAAEATVIDGPIADPANGHIYYLLSQNTWTASEAEAISLGGHLATIDDTAENSWVLNTFSLFGGSAKTLWIGLTDIGHIGDFEWISGEAAMYQNWARFGGVNNEPNNIGIEHYVQIYDLHRGIFAGFWNNLADATVETGVPLHGVVEVATPSAAVPEPSAVALCGSGLMVLGLVHHRRARMPRGVRSRSTADVLGIAAARNRGAGVQV